MAIRCTLPFSSSSDLSFSCSSNGWLAFVSRENEMLHLFDPVSNHALFFPPLYPHILRHYNNLKSKPLHATRLYLAKVVASPCLDSSVAVAGIIELYKQIDPITPERRVVFCRYGCGNSPRWSILMERSKGIKDIVLADDGRFYAVGENWEFYMLEERPLLIRLKRFKLCLSKQVSASNPDNDPVDKRVSTICLSIEASGESNLKLKGRFRIFELGGGWISLKINVANLISNSNKVVAAYDAGWGYPDQSLFNFNCYFSPTLKNKGSKLKCHRKDKILILNYFLDQCGINLNNLSYILNW